jgi:RsiW-degrading membrane proteinase PrsW (M82 family)
VLGILRWMVPALVPAVLFAFVIYRTDKRREPAWLVTMTFVLGAIAAGVAFFIQYRAAHFTGLDARISGAGGSGRMLFLFALVAPVREAAKVAACWPAFRSKHFDEPYDGIVYSSVAALGFAVVENAIVLHQNPHGAIWWLRVLLALPAHVFFACLWGYALGRAKQSKRPGAIFPMAWILAAAGHGLYVHLVEGRGPGALVAVVPMILFMGVVSFFAGRDLRARGDRASHAPGPLGNRLSRISMSYVSAPPSLAAVRAALKKSEQPIKVRWIVFGALVTIGAMVAGIAAMIIVGRWAQIDFAVVDEHDLATTGPVALLAAGLLAAFPVSGYLVARASSAGTILEPALATALALVVTMVILGLAAPMALVFALAFSPIAWALACAGAWVGRPAR